MDDELGSNYNYRRPSAPADRVPGRSMKCERSTGLRTETSPSALLECRSVGSSLLPSGNMCCSFNGQHKKNMVLSLDYG